MALTGNPVTSRVSLRAIAPVLQYVIQPVLQQEQAVKRGLGAMARITKTLQLVEGQDDDLIDWFKSLPDGEGQRLFKKMLRAGITCGKQPPQSSTAETSTQTITSIIDPSITETFTTLASSISELVQAIKESAATIPLYQNTKPRKKKLPKPVTYADRLALQTEDPAATMEAAANVLAVFG